MRVLAVAIGFPFIKQLVVGLSRLCSLHTWVATTQNFTTPESFLYIHSGKLSNKTTCRSGHLNLSITQEKNNFFNTYLCMHHNPVTSWPKMSINRLWYSEKNRFFPLKEPLELVTGGVNYVFALYGTKLLTQSELVHIMSWDLFSKHKES